MTVPQIYFLLVERWGDGAVLPLIYEETAKDPSRFVARLMEFLAMPADTEVIDALANEGSRRSNVSLSPLWMGPERVCNRLTRRTRFNSRPAFGHLPRVHLAVRALLIRVDEVLGASAWPVNRRLHESQRATSDEIARGFADSNRCFALATGLDLASYGYST